MVKRRKRPMASDNESDDDYDYKQGFRVNGKVEEPYKSVDDKNLA